MSVSWERFSMQMIGILDFENGIAARITELMIMIGQVYFEYIYDAFGIAWLLCYLLETACLKVRCIDLGKRAAW